VNYARHFWFSPSLFCVFFTPPPRHFPPVLSQTMAHSSRSPLLPLQKDGKLYNTLLFAVGPSLSVLENGSMRAQSAKSQMEIGRAATRRFSLVTRSLVVPFLHKLKSERRKSSDVN
jgi:hypothetical protein